MKLSQSRNILPIPIFSISFRHGQGRITMYNRPTETRANCQSSGRAGPRGPTSDGSSRLLSSRRRAAGGDTEGGGGAREDLPVPTPGDSVGLKPSNLNHPRG
ncbi:hypothetical protein Egran_01584 [Elaphomyces granulatus]|uniref:Uncharacterized protein n=1 Tax=Elaphomyces granulatus TaxID=519963 RepID=A0A232M2T4_9EURO|nr:hypothetical protein Egran_01584 [Elaphomyces granulatus]